jgi:uncharacterized membrane protein
MKVADLKKEWLQVVILAVPFCAVALLWDKLPGWVPIHWNARGEVDGIARKAFGTLLVPLINVGLACFMSLLPLIDPKLRKHDPEMRASLWRTVRIFRLAITAFMSFASLAMLAATLKLFKNGANFTYAIYIGMGFLFVVMGNSMTKLRPNYFVGIRTPWTLESKEVWARTHRVGGRFMMIAGLLMIGLCFVVPLELYVFCVVLPFILGFALFSILYSYMLYKKLGGVRHAS